MLDYIINTYYDNDFDMLLFLHDHEVASHYPFSITKRIYKNMKYIYDYNFIGVNCHYYDKNYWIKSNAYLKYEIVNNYLTNRNIDHVNFTDIIQHRYTFPCCASFYVKRKLIHLHNVQYYITLRNALRNFSLFGSDENDNNDMNHIKKRNYYAAVYMEFVWSTMFGQTDVSLPPDCSKSSLSA